jgi:2-polyprenyl-3-methyl-5-hydroxy-6-metoxy-1,4-benzoquinol methylase
MGNNNCDCGGKEYGLFLKNNKGSSIVKCSYCSLLRTYPFPKSTISEPVDFENRLKNLNLWRSFSYKIILLIRKYKENNNLRVLDLGSNIGIFVDLARKEGWNATGIDVDKRAIEIGKKKFKVDLRDISLEKTNFIKEEFDVVLLLHTLEHIYELKQLIHKIKQIMKKDGILIIQVPNINGLPVKIQHLRRKSWYGYDFSHHLWHFQPETLIDLLIENGFEIREIDTHSSMYYENTEPITDYIRKIILWFSSLINSADQITLVATPKK